jgi:hypothetical protein
MKNSYQGYWFSCETTYSDDIGTRRWILLLESKLTKNMRYHTVGLNNEMTMGEVLKLAYEEIEKLNQEEAKQ